MLEDIGVVATSRWVQELLNPKKPTYPLMSESGAEYCWDVLPGDLREALLDFMDVNGLVESSFTGVTAQLQVFGWIGMTSAAAISNTARNGFLDQVTTNKEMSYNKTSLFHDFPEELQITAIIWAVQEDTATWQPKTNDMDRKRNVKQEMDKLVKR